MENQNGAPRKTFYKTVLTHKLFYVGLAALLGLIFLLQNNRPVEIDFFFWTLASANLLVTLLIVFLLGAVSGFFGREIVKYRFSKKTRRANRTSYPRHSEV